MRVSKMEANVKYMGGVALAGKNFWGLCVAVCRLCVKGGIISNWPENCVVSSSRLGSWRWYSALIEGHAGIEGLTWNRPGFDLGPW